MKKLYKLLVLCLFAIAGGSALKAQDVVAKVGDTEYSDFSSAINNWYDGTTLTLLADVERTSSITISNKSVVFDLNGHTYTSSWNIFTVNSGAALTITDTSEDGDGLITYTGSGNYAVFIDGVVTVAGGKITSSAEHNSTIYNSGGTLNITGGILEHTKEDAVDCVSSSTCYISGGNIGGIELDNSNLTVSGNPTLGRVAMYDSFVDISGVTTEGYVITAWYCSVTVGVDLILPEGLELQVETLPVDKLIIGQSGVVSHHHEGGTATCDGQAICDICGKPYGLKLPHDFDEHGECNNCHNHATMSVTDGMNTYYADDATSLNTAVTHILENGSRTFTVNLPSEAEAKIFTAIRRAIIDTEGVEDGSINLTLSGVKAIPNHDEFDPSNLIFGDYYGDELESVYQLASVNLPDVISIGEGAFCGCENLVSITAPKAQTMGKHALYYTALTTVEFPELTTIPSFMMDGTWTLVSAKFPKVTTIESGGLLIGALFKPEAFLLELTAKEDITFVGNNHFNVASQNYSDKVDLVLHINKLDEVDNLTWKGYTFKSINFISTYEVTASVNEENFGTVTGAGTYNDGEEATLVATPNEGYKFVNWTENDTIVSEEAEYTFIVDGNRNLVANFVTLHEVTVSVNDESFGTVAGAGVYGYGEEVTLTVTPNEGYKFVNWTENDTIVSGEAEFTFVVKGDRNFVANFELLTYEVTASVNEENFGTVAGAGVYGYGEEVTLTATPNEGYKFVNWTENDTVVSEEAEFTFVVKGDRNFVANFELLTYEVTASVNEENFGVVTGSGTYNHGEEVTLTAIPNEGYKFVNWTENDTVVSGEAEYTFVVKGNRNLVANFELLTYEVTVSVNEENFGVVTGSGTYNHGEEVTLTATANEGYKFVNWTENDTVVSGEAEYTFVVKGNRNLVANFELLTYEVTSSVNEENFGTVAGAGVYGYGEEVTLTATPNEGYKFVNWTENDTVVSGEAEFTFVVKGDRNFVANFVSTESIDELTASFRLYPNPVNDKLYIEDLTLTQTLTIEIYDIYGRCQELSAVSCQPSAIEVSNLKSGVYFVKIVTSEGETVKRFVKK